MQTDAQISQKHDCSIKFSDQISKLAVRTFNFLNMLTIVSSLAKTFRRIYWPSIHVSVNFNFASAISDKFRFMSHNSK